MESASLYSDAFSSPKQTILHTYRNEINQLQLNYSTNIHQLIPRFMKSSCVITIQLNTLTDVLYEMTVGGTFVCVRERDRVKDFVYITRGFSHGPQRPRYNGVAVYIPICCK